jgi:hypothetical protein
MTPVAPLDITSTASTLVGINSTNASGVAVAWRNSGSPLGFIGSAKAIVTGGLLNDFAINMGNSNNLIISVNQTEVARFTTSGILGIGITPSAWNTFNAVQVGLLSLASYTNGDTDISSNLYYNSGWKYIGTGRSAQIKLDSSSSGGNIKFLVDATGGTAGGATAGSEVARFGSDGSFLVGTTTNAGAGCISASGGIFPGATTTVSVSTNSWSANTWYTLVATGVLAQGAYWVSLRWDHTGGSPYVIAASFMASVVNTNGTGTDTQITLLTVTHTGGGATGYVRAVAGNSSVTGFEIQFTAIQTGTLTAKFYKFA